MLSITKTYKERAAIKGKANHEKGKSPSRSLSVAPANTVLTYFNVETLSFFSRKLGRENKIQQKQFFSCIIILMQTTKKQFFTPAPILYTLRYSFAISTGVGNLLITDFVKKSRFYCCF